MNPTSDQEEFDSLTGTTDAQQGNMIRMHAALVGQAIKKAWRKPPMTINATGSLRGPVSGQIGGESQFRLRAPKNCNTIIIANYLNLTVYVWQGDDTNLGGPWWITCGTLTWLQFTTDPAIEAYTISVKPQATPVYATSGVCYMKATDSDLGCATGTLAV